MLWDVYNSAKKIAYESKVGYVSLTSFVKNQIFKDGWLLKNGGGKRIEYMQNNYGIKVVVHDS